LTISTSRNAVNYTFVAYCTKYKCKCIRDRFTVCKYGLWTTDLRIRRSHHDSESDSL